MPQCMKEMNFVCTGALTPACLERNFPGHYAADLGNVSFTVQRIRLRFGDGIIACFAPFTFVYIYSSWIGKKPSRTGRNCGSACYFAVYGAAAFINIREEAAFVCTYDERLTVSKSIC